MSKLNLKKLLGGVVFLALVLAAGVFWVNTSEVSDEELGGPPAMVVEPGYNATLSGTPYYYATEDDEDMYDDSLSTCSKKGDHAERMSEQNGWYPLVAWEDGLSVREVVFSQVELKEEDPVIFVYFNADEQKYEAFPNKIIRADELDLDMELKEGEVVLATSSRAGDFCTDYDEVAGHLSLEKGWNLVAKPDFDRIDYRSVWEVAMAKGEGTGKDLSQYYPGDAGDIVNSLSDSELYWVYVGSGAGYEEDFSEEFIPRLEYSTFGANSNVSKMDVDDSILFKSKDNIEIKSYDLEKINISYLNRDSETNEMVKGDDIEVEEIDENNNGYFEELRFRLKSGDFDYGFSVSLNIEKGAIVHVNNKKNDKFFGIVSLNSNGPKLVFNSEVIAPTDPLILKAEDGSSIKSVNDKVLQISEQIESADGKKSFVGNNNYDISFGEDNKSVKIEVRDGDWTPGADYRIFFHGPFVTYKDGRVTGNTDLIETFKITVPVSDNDDLEDSEEGGSDSGFKLDSSKLDSGSSTTGTFQTTDQFNYLFNNKFMAVPNTGISSSQTSSENSDIVPVHYELNDPYRGHKWRITGDGLVLKVQSDGSEVKMFDQSIIKSENATYKPLVSDIDNVFVVKSSLSNKSSVIFLGKDHRLYYVNSNDEVELYKLNGKDNYKIWDIASNGEKFTILYWNETHDGGDKSLRVLMMNIGSDGGPTFVKNTSANMGVGTGMNHISITENDRVAVWGKGNSSSQLWIANYNSLSGFSREYFASNFLMNDVGAVGNDFYLLDVNKKLWQHKSGAENLIDLGTSKAKYLYDYLAKKSGAKVSMLSDLKNVYYPVYKVGKYSISGIGLVSTGEIYYNDSSKSTTLVNSSLVDMDKIYYDEETKIYKEGPVLIGDMLVYIDKNQQVRYVKEGDFQASRLVLGNNYEGTRILEVDGFYYLYYRDLAEEFDVGGEVRWILSTKERDWELMVYKVLKIESNGVSISYIPGTSVIADVVFKVNKDRIQTEAGDTTSSVRTYEGGVFEGLLTFDKFHDGMVQREFYGYPKLYITGSKIKSADIRNDYYIRFKNYRPEHLTISTTTLGPYRAFR